MPSQPRVLLKQDGETVLNSVKVNLEGRFMSPSRAEHPCSIVEMSIGEIAISSAEKPAPGDHVIVYVAELGRFEGVVARHDPAGFALCMTLTAQKQRKLAEQLVWFANRDALQLDEHRRHKRIAPLVRLTSVRLANGAEHVAKINDISRSGVSVEISVSLLGVRLLVGSRVFMDSKAATVLRVYKDGFVAEFEESFDLAEIDEAFGSEEFPGAAARR